jgi:predicted metalloprotease with PDZ domain
MAWTSYHELAHLLIPYRGWGDAWFSEGLASYYQNLMQARSGVLSEQAMWQKLYEGFQRGRAEHAFDGQSLQQVSDGLRQSGGFMRVYWSGAWYFLAADTRLRMQSGGKVSLDDALEKLNRCCADTPLSVPDMVDKLDELNRVVLFRPLYEDLIASTAVPPFETIFASLGISLRSGNVSLQKAGPGAEIRRAISRAKPGSLH